MATSWQAEREAFKQKLGETITTALKLVNLDSETRSAAESIAQGRLGRVVLGQDAAEALFRVGALSPVLLIAGDLEEPGWKDIQEKTEYYPPFGRKPKETVTRLLRVEAYIVKVPGIIGMVDTGEDVNLEAVRENFRADYTRWELIRQPDQHHRPAFSASTTPQIAVSTAPQPQEKAVKVTPREKVVTSPKIPQGDMGVNQGRLIRELLLLNPQGSPRTWDEAWKTTFADWFVYKSEPEVAEIANQAFQAGVAKLRLLAESGDQGLKDKPAAAKTLQFIRENIPGFAEATVEEIIAALQAKFPKKQK